MINLDLTNNTRNITFTNKRKAEFSYADKYEHIKMFSSKRNEKISFEEGLNILGKGIKGQFKDTLDAIVKNPIKTLTGILGISATLMLLPLIGIPSAVGGGAFAIGFAGVAIYKAISHSLAFANANKNGSRDIARYQLEQVGRDSFDLAISIPFVPKAISNIQKYGKYGNFGINSELINELKITKGLSNKFKILQKTNTHLYRQMNFKKAVDDELALLKNISEKEKLSIKEELLSYNVREDKLASLVLEKWAKEHNIETLPDLGYESMAKNTQGYASEKDCSIILNDHKVNIPSPYDDLKITYQETKNGVVKAIFKDTKTGQLYRETIEQELLNEYNTNCAIYNQLSPQAKCILTTIHEREHIAQFIRLIQLKGFDCIKNLTPRGKELYQQMISQMPQIQTGTQEALEAESLISFNLNPTLYNYIKRPFEIGARRVEFETCKNPVFQKLNKIFEYTNKHAKSSLSGDIFMTDVRLESGQN